MSFFYLVILHKSPNLKSAIFNSNVSDNPGICHVVQFEIHQFVLGTDSPNLMLSKVYHYTVVMQTVSVLSYIL